MLSALLVLVGLLGSSAAASTGFASASYDATAQTYQIQYYTANADTGANPTISLDLSGAPGLISSTVTNAVYTQLADAITVTTLNPSETLQASDLSWDPGTGILSFSYQGATAADGITITLGPSPYIHALPPLTTVGLGIKTDADTSFATADLTMPDTFAADLTSLTTASSLAALNVTVYPATRDVTTAVYVESPDAALDLTSAGVQATVDGSPVAGSYDSTADAYVIPDVDVGTGFTLGLTRVPAGPPSTALHALDISTLADPGGTRVEYTLGSVQDLAVTLSDLAAEAASSYSIRFSTQSPLSTGDAIDVQLPTVQSALPSSDISLTANGSAVPFAAPTFDAAGGDLVVPLSAPVAAGSQVTLTVGTYQDIPNPSDPSDNLVAVWTSADSQPAAVTVGYGASGGAPGGSAVPVQAVASHTGSGTEYSVTYTPTIAIAGGADQTVNITGVTWDGTPSLADVTAAQGTTTLTPSYIDYVGGMLSVAFRQTLAAGTQVSMRIGASGGTAGAPGTSPSLPTRRAPAAPSPGDVTSAATESALAGGVVLTVDPQILLGMLPSSTMDITFRAAMAPAQLVLAGGVLAALGADPVTLSTPDGSVTVPIAAVLTPAVLEQLGAVDLSHVQLTISIAPTAASSFPGLTVLGTPLSTQVTATVSGTSTTLEQLAAPETAVLKVATAPDPSTTTVAELVDGAPEHARVQFSGVDATVLSWQPGTFAVVSQTRNFGDVSGLPQAQAIGSLADKLVTGGTGSGAYDPQGGVTRAQFAALLVRALGLWGFGQDVGFRDVPGGYWAAAVVSAASAEKFIEGYPDGTFHPGAQITNDQMAAIVARAMAYLGIPQGVATIAPRDQRAIPAWATSDVALVLSRGIMTTDAHGDFAPAAVATRAESAEIIWNLMQAAGIE